MLVFCAAFAILLQTATAKLIAISGVDAPWDLVVETVSGHARHGGKVRRLLGEACTGVCVLVSPPGRLSPVSPPTSNPAIRGPPSAIEC